MKRYSWTMSGMDDYVFDVTAIAYRRLGNYAHARSVTEALRWYIPRANVEFCKLLAKKNPSAVAAILLKAAASTNSSSASSAQSATKRRFLYES